jgi:hypothetical protein
MALPLLDAMRPRRSRADAASPKRFFTFFVPNGLYMERWAPPSNDIGADYTLTPLLEPLRELKNDFLILGNISNPPSVPGGPGDHACGTAAMLSAHKPRKTDGSDIEGGITVDQIVANAWKGQTRFASLELAAVDPKDFGVGESGWNPVYARNLSWGGPQQPMPREMNARKAFERLFSDGTGTRRYPKKSVLDTVLGQANSLQSKLGTNDRRKVDEYLTSVREVESRLDGPLPGQPGAEISADRNDLRGQLKGMLDVAVLAFQADLTRVATLMLGQGASDASYDFLGFSDSHHYLSHHGGDEEKLEKIAKINRWEVEQLAYFLTKMKGIQEGEGNLLDHSIVLFSSEIGDGNSHSHMLVPVLVAGRGDGALSPGRHLFYEDNPPLERLHASMLEALGVPLSTIDGRPVTPLPQLQG